MSTRTSLILWVLVGCSASGSSKDCPAGTHSEDGQCVETALASDDSGLDVPGDADTDTDTDSGAGEDTGETGGETEDRDSDGFSEADGDCDDLDDTVHPAATDIWYDGIDTDCDEASDYDADRDGHDSTAYGGDDCDDTDVSVGPHVGETWYDGIDSDCDEANDFDADADGYEAKASGGDDCDDEAASIYPGATDVWYDGIDSDCAGNSDFDADGDGDDSSSYGGTDCVDTDMGIYSGAPEMCDEVDSDCDDSLLDATWGDHDADGLPDCVDPDAPDILHGGVWRWDGVSGSTTGIAIAFYEDTLLLGAPNAEGGLVYVLSDLTSGVRDLESAAIAIGAVDSGVSLGTSVEGANSSSGRKLVVGLRNASAVAVLSMPTDDVDVSVSDL